MGATAKSKRERWAEVVAKTGKCPFCPAHNGENAKRRPRSDKYKSKRKGRETKGERAIRKKRELDFALNYGAFGYPFTEQGE